MANKGNDLGNDENELCEKCKSIPATTFYNSGQPRIRSEYELGQEDRYQLIKGSNAFEELKLSAKAGCGLCKLFEDALRLSEPDPYEKVREQPKYSEDGVRLRRTVWDYLEIAFGKLCFHRLDARLIIFTGQYTTKSIEPTSYVIETESDSPANFALARSWLAECCKDHVDCRDLLEFELPRRLLDVEIPSKPRIVRLVSALDLPTKSRADYAALSHCWGSFWPLQTKRDNLGSHVQEIPESRLPQTFQDAVRTTRELGLRYLWIDSLCIVQDEPTEIEVECARMNTIFSNAICTISASDARDCRDGLFRSRTIRPIRLNYLNDDFEPTLSVIVQPAFHRGWMRELEGPLQSRAWVVQERHLSPRIIHYTKKCLMWECRTATASEHQQDMRPKVDLQSSLRPHLPPDRFFDGGRSKLGLEDTRSCLPYDEFPSLHDRWYRVVQEYSHRLLSRPEDKLPALSGFAAEWKRMKPEDEYFAGLWKSDIFKGLSWFPWSASTGIMRPLPENDSAWPPLSPFEGIPSWSWAAFDGPVAHFGTYWFDKNYYDCNLDTLEAGQQRPSRTSCPLRLHNVTTTIGQLNPFGSVRKGEISVSSWSIVVTLRESDFTPIYSMIGCAPKTYPLYPNPQSRLPLSMHGMVYFDHDPFCLPKIQVRLLQLGMGRAVYGDKDCACGLALLQVQTEELTSNEDLYKRVGMFHIKSHSFWLRTREWKTVTII